MDKYKDKLAHTQKTWMWLGHVVEKNQLAALMCAREMLVSQSIEFVNCIRLMLTTMPKKKKVYSTITSFKSDASDSLFC